MTLQQVAFDIETTGFAADDVVTVAGFVVPPTIRIFVQASSDESPDPTEELTAAVQDQVSMDVHVSIHEQEPQLLDALGTFVREQLVGGGRLLTAYNGEVWRGGFDLPFLRTRFARAGVRWPFDLPYTDLMPVVTNRFNTTDQDGEEYADLAGVYDVLCDGSYDELDPFADSGAAVRAFDEGRVMPVLLHNVADVLRTQALGRLAEQYCSKSEFDVKSLTATTDG